MVKFELDHNDAIKAVQEHNEKRLFAPLKQRFTPNNAIEPYQDPIQAHYLPFTCYQMKTVTHYSGYVGDTYYYTVIIDKKPVIESYVIWRGPFSGRLTKHYSFKKDKLTHIYSGLNHAPHYVEEVVTDPRLIKYAENFDAGRVPKDAKLEPYRLREQASERVARDKICDNEYQRARSELQRRHGGDSISDVSVKCYYENIQHISVYLPAYTYTPPHTQLSLWISGATGQVMGDNQMSLITTSLAAGITPLTLSIGARLMCMVVNPTLVLGSTLASVASNVIWNLFRERYLLYNHNSTRQQRRTLSLEYPTSQEDTSWRKFKLEFENYRLKHGTELSEFREELEILGLDPARDWQLDQIREAFQAQAMLHHPDHNPGDEAEATKRFIRCRKAYATLRQAFERHKPAARGRPL